MYHCKELIHCSLSHVVRGSLQSIPYHNESLYNITCLYESFYTHKYIYLCHMLNLQIILTHIYVTSISTKGHVYSGIMCMVDLSQVSRVFVRRSRVSASAVMCTVSEY
jgi:hypothetical protein